MRRRSKLVCAILWLHLKRQTPGRDLMNALMGLLTYSAMKVSFSLTSKAKTQPVGNAPPSLKRSAAFASLDDDEPIDAAPTASSSTGKTASANKQILAQNVAMSKAMKKKMEEEQKIDATVFEYDEVWDKIQDAKARQKNAKEADAKERKVSIRNYYVLHIP